jgi:hypothetical protein
MQELKKLLVLNFLLCCGVAVKTQSNLPEKKQSTGGTIYFAIGINRSLYSKSDIALKSSVYPAFDFRLKDVRAIDDQGLKFHNGAPQYSYELGYYCHQKSWGLEFNFDHIKYFMRQYQRVRMQGSINDHFYDTDTLITPGFIQFEHSDGANYALLKWVKWKPLFLDKSQKKELSLVCKAGTGPVIPKTNSTIMGKHRDDIYKVAGYVAALEGALRYNYSGILFAEASAKYAYAHYGRFLIADGTGSQRWFGLHFELLFGLQLTTN